MDKNCINFNIFYSLFSLLSLHFILFSSLSPVPSLLPLFLSPIPLNLSHPLKPLPPISPIVRLAQLLSISSAAIDLTQPRSISLTVSPSPITADLTLFPILSVRLSLCLSLVVDFYLFIYFFLLQFGLI